MDWRYFDIVRSLFLEVASADLELKKMNAQWLVPTDSLIVPVGFLMESRYGTNLAMTLHHSFLLTSSETSIISSAYKAVHTESLLQLDIDISKLIKKNINMFLTYEQNS